MYGKYSDTLNYFDRRSNEEDLPVEVELSAHAKYQTLENIYEEFFDENSLNVAKVNFRGIDFYFSHFLKKKEIRKILMILPLSMEKL